jgi:hypothetical protein
MIKFEQVPDEVVDAAVAMRDRGGSMRDIIRTAINAWPGMDYRPGAKVTKSWTTPGKIILPLTTENTND